MPFDTYAALIEGIGEIISAGKDLSSQSRGRRIARRNWEIGDVLHTHLLANQGKTAYGEGLIKRVSKDLNLERTNVYLMLRFRRSMPIVESIPLLTWTHYIQLISLKTQNQREFYLRAARHEGWNVKELKHQIRNDLYSAAQQLGSVAYRPSAAAVRPLKPRKGQLYTYRLVRALPGQTAAADYVVDLGFYSQWPGRLEGVSPQAGMIVTCTKKRNAAEYRFVGNSAHGRKLYTVKAIPERIIDGDTLLARIDQGFHTWRTERLRLRGIDCPELYSTMGRQARAYVEEMLAPVDFVVISTISRDLYGRYLTDLFYLPGSDDPAEVLSEGVFLNRQLLDEGLARPYGG